MNKVLGIGIGVAIVIVAGAIYGISESEFLKTENEKDTKMGFQDEVEVTVERAEKINEPVSQDEINEFTLQSEAEINVERNLDVKKENQSGRVFNFTVEEKFRLTNP